MHMWRTEGEQQCSYNVMGDAFKKAVSGENV
jgi:hypothetical protein